MRAEIDRHDHTQTLSMYLFTIVLVFMIPKCREDVAYNSDSCPLSLGICSYENFLRLG